MTTLEVVLVAWAGVLAALVGALALATRHRRPPAPHASRSRRAAVDRRRGGGDRRVGLPDLRADRVERRSGTGDRRTGARDRRRVLGAA